MKNHNHQKKIETLNTRWHFLKKDKSNPKKETNKAKESENSVPEKRNLVLIPLKQSSPTKSREIDS